MRGSSAQIEYGLSFRILASNLSCVLDSNPSNNLSKSWIFSGFPFRSRHCHAFSAISVASDNKIGLANIIPPKRNESCCRDSDFFPSNSFATHCNDFAFNIIESASQFSTSFLFSGTSRSPRGSFILVLFCLRQFLDVIGFSGLYLSYNTAPASVRPLTDLVSTAKMSPQAFS